MQRLSGLVIAILLAAAPTIGSDRLPHASAESRDIDPIRLDIALARMGQLPHVFSTVVIRDGFMVAEEYFLGSEVQRYDGRSVTKSVTSTLVGIAIDHGFISDIDDRMVDYLPPYLHASDPAADAITIRHLLTMTSGFLWSESNEIVGWVNSPIDPGMLLSRPVVTPPGSAYNYSTPASHLLSVVLAEATGMDTAEFAEEYLFEPLGIDSHFWPSDTLGYNLGGHGIMLHTEDVAKLGILFINRGVYGGLRVLSEEWIQDATAIHIQGFGDFGALRDIHYGYLWWLSRGHGYDVFIAWGWGGQFVFSVPELQLVVAVHSNWRVDGPTANDQEMAILDVIVNSILPAVHERSPRRPRGRTSPLVGELGFK